MRGRHLRLIRRNGVAPCRPPSGGQADLCRPGRPHQAIRRNGVAPVSPPSGGKADLCEQKAHILVKTWPCQPISVNVRLILKTQKALKVPNVSLIPIYVYKNRF